MQEISFNYIRSLFDDTWDVGVITEDQLLESAMVPIKEHFISNNEVANFYNSVHYKNMMNTIVLIKQGETWDYSHYNDAFDIFTNSIIPRHLWIPVKTNYKMAAIQAGLAVRARNSLVYSYRFGFDCHIAAYGIKIKVTDFPTNRRVNRKIWRRCVGCDDCAKACPVGAIHNDAEPNWINSSACDNFITFSDHPKIPSIKKFWHENVYPELTSEEIKSLQTVHDAQKYLGQNGLPWDKNGYHFDGNVTTKDGVKVNIPVCRECTSQPRCSKWAGSYPYERVFKQEKVYPVKFIKMKNFGNK